MASDHIAEFPDSSIQVWPKPPVRSRKTVTARTLRRWRAKARAKWPKFMPDVAYRIEGLPQPRRPYGRTWEQITRDNFLASFPPGIPPWAGEALKPEFRPRTAMLDELLAPFTEDELAAFYY